MDLNKRIAKETRDLATKPPPGISATPKADNPRYFDCLIMGPPGTPYEGGTFKLELYLPTNYPMDPPKCRFLTKIYHPNIDKLGRICLDILKSKWSPILQISKLLISIQSLLSDPNPADPLDTAVALQWIENHDEAIKTAKEWTQKYALN